jgi:hypothetical protein
VPADRRLLGLDRRTLLPAGVVALLFVVAVWVLPAVDRSVAVQDPVRAGEVIQVGTVEFVPVAGSNIVAGLRQGRPGADGTYPETAAVTYQGTVFEVDTDEYTGTPLQLLEQIKKNDKGTRYDSGPVEVTSDPVTVVNADGDKGVAAHYESGNANGLIAAFVFDGTGVEIQVLGPEAVADGVSQDVAAMLQSVRPITTGSGS